MALTTEELRAFAAQINQIYGNGTIDPENVTEDQLRTFAATQTKSLEEQLNKLENSAHPRFGTGLYTQQGKVEIDGEWDKELSTRLFDIETTIASPNFPQRAQQEVDAAGDFVRAQGYYRGSSLDIRTAEGLAQRTANSLQGFDANKLYIIRTLNDKLENTDTAGAFAEKRVAALQPELNTLRDWINTNKDALNDFIPDGTPHEEHKKVEIQTLSDKNATLQDPAFSKAYVRTVQIYTILEQQDRLNEFPASFKNASDPVLAVNDAILAYGNLYFELGENANISPNPLEAIKQAEIFGFKKVVHNLINAKAFSQVPKFDIKKNTLDPADPDFLKSLQGLYAAFDKQGLTGEKLTKRSDAAIGAILADPKQDPALKQQLEQITDPSIKLDYVMSNLLPPQDVQKINIALQMQMPPPSIAAAFNSQITPQASPKPANPDATKTQQPPPKEQQTTLSVMERIPQQIRHSVLTVEEAYEAQAERGLNNDKPYSIWFDKPDGIYDPQTQDMVENTVMSLFERYGTEYVNGEKSILSTQGDYIFTFDKNGSIFTSEFKDGEYVKKDKVGHITDGIHTSDPTLLHEATVQFMQRMNVEFSSFQGKKPSITGQNDQAELEKTIKKQDEDIKAFFSGNPALQEIEGDFRKALKDSKGIGLDPFKATNLGKRIKDAKGDDAEFATFMAAIFMSEQNRIGLSTDIIEFDLERTQVSSIFNLFQVMTGSSYDPNIINDMYVGAPARDNVLSLDAYNILRNMKHGETVSISRLYDENNPEQKAALLKEFEGRAEITREEVYTYVRKQLDLRAIGTLRPDLKEEIDALKTPADQTDFINRHLDVLKNVSQAMYNGDFNPYEEDLKLGFRAFPRPEITDPRVNGFIELHRNNGNIPSPQYALCNMSNNDLISITGNKDFNSLPMSEKESELKRALNSPMSEIIGNPAHARLAMSFYEPLFGLGEFTSWRNGDPDLNDPETYNGRYGNVTDDQCLYMFMFRNSQEMEEIFEPGAQKIFFKGATNVLNKDLTCDEVIQKLRERDPTGSKGLVKEFKHQLADLNNPSMYTYMIDINLYHCRNMRINSYLPKTLVREKLASEEFQKKAQPAEQKNNDTSTPGAKDSTQTQQKELSQAFTDQLKDPFVDNLIVPRSREIKPAPSKTIPKGTSGAADKVLRAFEIADNAKPYSQKHTKAVQTANNIMKMHDMTEAQVRLYGLEKGQNLIPAHKAPSAKNIVRALEIADNAKPYSAKHAKAMQTANNIMKMSGLSEAQARLHGITLGKSLIPAGTDSSAKRIARALEIADNAPTLKKQTAALNSAQNMMKMSGLTEAQVRTHTAALNNPKLIKTLEAQAQKAANAEARTAKTKSAANNITSKTTEGFETTAKNATEKLTKQAEKVMTVKSTTTSGNTGTIITTSAQETINPSAILNADITGTTAGPEIISTKAHMQGPASSISLQQPNVKPLPENITINFENAAQNTGKTTTTIQTNDVTNTTTQSTTKASDVSGEQIKNTTNDIVAASNDVKIKKPWITDNTARAGSRALMIGAAGWSTYHAISTREEGTFTTAVRGSVAAMDTGILLYDWRHSKTAISKIGLAGTTGAISLLTTGAEIGVALHNKDGQTAGAATVIGGLATAGAIGGSFVGPVGTFVGGAGGAVIGVGVVAFTKADNSFGRVYNNSIYEGGWFNAGMIKETEDIMKQAKIYFDKLQAGDISQAELTKYHVLLQTIEDHVIDLKNSEASLIENAANWNTLDTNQDGNLSTDEAGANNTAATDYKLRNINLNLQDALIQTRTILSTAYDNQRHSQLSALLNGAANAKDLQAKLHGEFSHVTKNLSGTWQGVMFWKDQTDWRETLNETRQKMRGTNGKNMSLDNLTADEANDLRRTVHNTRHEVEERIQNLLYNASNGKLSELEFNELKSLKRDLEITDKIEKVLWAENIQDNKNDITGQSLRETNPQQDMNQTNTPQSSL